MLVIMNYKLWDLYVNIDYKLIARNQLCFNFQINNETFSQILLYFFMRAGKLPETCKDDNKKDHRRIV